MADSLFDFYLDITSITTWFNDLAFQCIPDWDALSKQPLSNTLDVFSTNLLIALTTTFEALRAWITLLFHLCRLLAHSLFLSFPYIKPIIVGSYRYWNSLTLTVQLILLGLCCTAALSYWIKRNRFIARSNQYVQRHINRIRHYWQSRLCRLKSWCKATWQSLIDWISTRSMMAAQMFPHLMWWCLLSFLLWFAADSVYSAHSVWSFIGCFLFPAIRTYSNIRKYAMFHESASGSGSGSGSESTMKEKQKKQLRECINPLRIWLQFWSSRAFIVWTYHLIGYTLSFIPGIVAQQLTAYIASHDAVFVVIMDWSILWLLATDHSLNWMATHLSSTIFRIHPLDPLDIGIIGNGSDSNDLNPIPRPQRRREIQSGGIADHISLSSVNALLSRMLSVIRLFVPKTIYEIIHDGLYQFLIFFSFLLFSPKLGSLKLGYLLPIYTSFLALHHLDELHSKIKLWNGNQRDALITPQASLLMTSSGTESQLRSRRNRSHRSASTSKVLSPSRSNPNPNPNAALSDDDNRRKSWSDLSFWLKPLDMFSFHGDDELSKNERKRKEMHQEADRVLSTIVDRLKYWMVFAVMEWVYHVIGDQIGGYIPFWNHFKFALILWLQLPIVPYSASTLYEYLIIPVVVLDIGHKADQPVLSIFEVHDDDGDGDDDKGNVSMEKVHSMNSMNTKKSINGMKKKHISSTTMVEGAKSMVLLDERRRKRERKEKDVIPTTRREKSMPMIAHSEDEDSGTDKKSDRSDDEGEFPRRLRI